MIIEFGFMVVIRCICSYYDSMLTVKVLFIGGNNGIHSIMNSFIKSDIFKSSRSVILIVFVVLVIGQIWKNRCLNIKWVILWVVVVDGLRLIKTAKVLLKLFKCELGEMVFSLFFWHWYYYS